MNPFSNPADNGQMTGVSPSNPINDPSFHSNQGSNTFDLSFQNLLTARYGEITPFFYMEGLGRDRIELRSSHDLRTYTLGAPLMSGLRMRKSNFSVSFKAMMPNTWNYLFVNPVKGDDVPDDAYCRIDVCALLRAIVEKYVATGTSDSDKFKLFTLLCCIASPGALLDNLGITLNTMVNTASGSPSDRADGFSNLDDVCDQFVHAIGSNSTTVIRYSIADPRTGDVVESEFVSDSSLSTAYELFSLVMQHPDCDIEFAPAILQDSGVNSFMNTLNSGRYFQTHELIINLYKVVAYQMIVSQFFTNDHIDNVYNSDLWLSNQKSLVYDVVTSDSARTFDYNGISVYYDVYSGHFLSDMVTALRSNSDISSPLYFFFNTFAFRRSLRYGDYFMSARPLPLAVGDVSVPVTGNKVSVIDVNKNLHIQRFLNAVNRVGSNMMDYARQIFGFTPRESDAMPRFISSEVVYIGSDEIENTAQSQGTINVNMVAQQSNYMFDVEISDPCIILGLLSFECTGAYRSSIERDNFHVTRYDSFIPELQHIGDQSVFQSERNGLTSSNPYGYQVRYAEYKFKYNQMHGGFTVDALKSWAFPVVTQESDVINEDTIRSRPSEFDVYYKSLTGASMSNRFHFQMSIANNVRANRAMDYQPNLL